MTGATSAVMSIVHGGQVLVSDATEVLLRDRVGLRPLGEHRLRGLRGRISVYQVLAQGRRANCFANCLVTRSGWVGSPPPPDSRRVLRGELGALAT